MKTNIVNEKHEENKEKKENKENDKESSGVIEMVNHTVKKTKKQNQPESFEKLVNFSQYSVNDKNASENGLTQDNERLLTFPNKLQSINMENVKKFKLKDLCNSRIYLSSLIVAAHTLKEPFHKSMENIVNACGGTYKAGPIKEISRAQAKAASDYGFRPFPTSTKKRRIVAMVITFNSSLINKQ